MRALDLPAPAPLEAAPPREDGASSPLDREEFELLAQRCRPRLHRLLRALLRDTDAVEPLVQESLLRAYRARAAFRGQARPETWVLSIALNLARDHMKDRRRAFWRRLVAGAGAEEAARTWRDPAPSPEQELSTHEQVQRVFAAVAAMPPGQREVFVLRFVEEMPLAEIAGVLRVTTGTVKAQLHRALRAVRRRLGEGP